MCLLVGKNTASTMGCADVLGRPYSAQQGHLAVSAGLGLSLAFTKDCAGPPTAVREFLFRIVFSFRKICLSFFFFN